jgi:hypothetical protein
VVRDDLAARLLVALERCDDLALASVLSPDVRMLVDTGDDTGGELRGRAPVTRALTARLMKHPDASLTAVRVNGGPGLALRQLDGTVVGVLTIDPDLDLGGSIGELWLSAAPGKLAHWNRRRPTVD